MEWRLSVAFLPILVCGLMCVVPMVLVAVGLRRGVARRASCDEPAGHTATAATPRAHRHETARQS